MKNKVLTVSPEQIAEFSDLVSDLEVDVTLAGSTEEGSVLLLAHYGSEKREAIDQLVSFLEEDDSEDDYDD